MESVLHNRALAVTDLHLYTKMTLSHVVSDSRNGTFAPLFRGMDLQ